MQRMTCTSTVSTLIYQEVEVANTRCKATKTTTWQVIVIEAVIFLKCLSCFYDIYFIARLTLPIINTSYSKTFWYSNALFLGTGLFFA